MNSYDYPLDESADVTENERFLDVYRSTNRINQERDLLVARVSQLEDIIKKYRRILYNVINETVNNLTSGMNNEMLLVTFGPFLEDLKIVGKLI